MAGASLLSKVIASAEEALEWFGGLSLFAGQVVRELFRRPIEFTETLKQIFEIGWRSAPLIVLSGLAVGAVLSMHTRATLERFGAEAMIPAALAFALIKETGPLITGLPAARVPALERNSEECASPSKLTRSNRWPSIRSSIW
jgi:ABC-type transporter Mla maintaining outer membrane lipid asymmetry permease subunit MlaE